MTPIDYNNPNDMWRNNGYDPYKGMSDEERMKAGCMQLVGILVAIIAALLICALLGSCTTTKYVPMPEYHTDTTYITKQQRDSFYLHDSIHIKERGDTVWIERWHTRCENHLTHDTTYISKTDSVPVPYPVIKEVERPLSKTQKGLMGIGLLSLLATIVAVAWKIKKFLPW
jgi:hypothetical protein